MLALRPTVRPTARRSTRPLAQAHVRPAARLAGLALLAATATATGCIRTRTDPATGRVAVDVRSPLQKGTVWDARLSGQGAAGQGPATTVAGTLRADVLNGQSTVALRVTGLQPGAAHPWRIHEGRCGEVGALFGNAYTYGTIRVNDQGVAEASATLPQLDIAKRYKVRLFLSPSDSTSEVACGNLTYR
jgi:hypothetical protein